MSVIADLESAGEVLSPAVRAALLALEARIAELERRLGLNSTNSSLPPSRDRPGVKRAKRSPSGRRPGAQPGHADAQRALLPPERVDRTQEHWPRACAHCGYEFLLRWEVGSPERRQVIELPPVRAQITEHRLHCLCCPLCQQRTRAAAPAGVGPGTTFGARLVGFAAALTLRCRASRRNTQAVLADLLDVAPPSVGTLQGLLEEASAALLPAYREVAGALEHSAAAGADETGWKRQGLRHWLWVATTARVGFFRLSRRRSAEERARLLGVQFTGVLTSDRAGAYRALPPQRRQLCWAHLRRDFLAWQERGGAAEGLGRWAVAETDRLFSLWHRFRAGEFCRSELQRRMRSLQARFTRLLYQAFFCGDTKIERMADQLLGHWISLWSFLVHEQVEPTNNEAERALRAGVIWRKLSFGSRSEEGMRLVERLLTLGDTAKKQHRSLLVYLTEAITAYRLAQPPPALLAPA